MMMMMADNDDDGHESINENESRGTASTTREAEAASTTTTSPPESPPTPVSPPVTTTTTTTPDNVPKVTSSEGKEEGESSEGEEEAEDGEDSNDDDHGGGQSIKEELGEEDNNIENKVDTTTDQLGLNVNKVMEDVVDMMHDDGEEEEEGEEDEEEDNVSKMDAEEEEEPEPEDEDDDVEEGEILEDGEVEDDSKSGPEMSKTDESDKKSLSTSNIASKESVQSSEAGGGDDQKKSKKSDEKGSSRQRSERRGTSKGKDLDSRDSKRNRTQKQSSGKKRGRGGNDSEDEGHSSDTNNAGLRRQKRPRGGPWSPESGSDGSESGEDGDSQGGDNSFSEDMMMQMFKQMQEMMGKMTKESGGGGGGSANKKKSKMEKIMEKMMKNQQNLDSREMRDMVLRNRRLFSRSGFDRDQRTSGGGGRGPRERDRRRNLTLAERRSLRERDRDRDRLMRDRDRDRLRDRDGKDRRSDSTPKTTTCKFFLEGKCHRGSECPFPHDGQQQKKKDICKFYLQGFCGKGEACLFMHGDFPCKFYHTGVECYSGDNCRFSHQPLTEETRAMLKSYLDSGELPDEVNHDSGNVTSGGNNSGSYQPMKPVAKRHAVLGDVTDDMRSSYWTWLWQQEMKELELAYTGNKRNLFCIEKQFVVNDKPATPPEAMVDGDYDDRENLAGGKVMSFYVDTMPDYDPAMTQSTTADIDDEEKLLEMMSYHDEDLRLPPPNVPTTTTTNSSHLTTVSAAGVDTPLEPSAENDTNSASSIVLPGPFATAIDPPPSLDPRLPVGNEVGSSPQQPPPPPQVSSSVIPEENLPKPALDLLRRIQQRNSQKQGGLGVNEDSESGDNSIAEPLTTSQETIDFQPKEEKKWIIESDEDDDTDDQPLKAALKNLQNQQHQFQQQSQHQPSMQQPSVEASKPKPKIDIAKMLNVIRQTTNQMSGTGAVAAASAAPATQHADFWQNIFSGTNLVPSGGGSSSTGSQEFRDPRFGSVSATGGLSSAVASEPRDPRLKRTKSESKSEMSSSIVSPSSSDTSMSQSSKSTESRRSSISSQSHHQPLVGSDDFKLIAVDAPPIDYSNYVSLYRNDVKMKNDPRLQKFFSKLPNYVMDHLTKPSLQSLSSSSSSSSLLTTSLLNSSSSPSSESSIKAGEVGILITTPSSPTKSTLPPLPPLTLTEPKSTIIPTIVPPPPPLMSPFELTTSRPSLAVPINSIADQIKSELESLDTPEQASYANFGAVNSVRVKQEQPESPPPASAATSVVDTSVNYDVTLRVKQERPEPVSLTHFSYGSGDS